MRIRDGVMAEFRRINLNTNFVNVVVADGVVHLWGLVESTTQRKALALAAKNVQGVTKVENHLSVQLLRTLGWE
jgi:osmotically-inducible protein OsmY